MKIHSNILTRSDLYAAVPNLSSMYISDISDSGSRSRARAWHVYLAGSSQSMTQHDRAHHAATYEEWGYFISYLFELDPEAIVGWYNGLSDFDSKTKNLFSTTVRG